MNSNHFLPSTVYRCKLARIRSNIQLLEEAALTLQTLPERYVHSAWTKIAREELSKKETNKGPFKKTLKKTIASFKQLQQKMYQEISQKFKEIDPKMIQMGEKLMQRLQALVKSSQKQYIKKEINEEIKLPIQNQI